MPRSASHADRAVQDQPALRLGLVGVGGVVEELGVEGVDVVVVVPQRAQRLPQLGEEPVRVVLAGSCPSRGRTACPTAPSRRRRRAAASRSSSRRRPRGRPRRGSTNAGQRVGDQRAQPRPPDAERAAGAGVPHPHQQAERRQRVDRVPLRRAAPARSRSRRRAATAATAARAPGPSPRPSAGSRPARAGPSAAGPSPGRRPGRRRRTSRKNAMKMSSSASRDSTNCSPSKHSSRPGDAAEQRGAGQPAGQPDHHRHHQRADDRARRPASRTGPSRRACSPSAISHLPASGCTTMLGVVGPEAGRGGRPGSSRWRRRRSR